MDTELCLAAQSRYNSAHRVRRWRLTCCAKTTCSTMHAVSKSSAICFHDVLVLDQPLRLKTRSRLRGKLESLNEQELKPLLRLNPTATTGLEKLEYSGR